MTSVSSLISLLSFCLTELSSGEAQLPNYFSSALIPVSLSELFHEHRIFLKAMVSGCRDGVVVKSTCCPGRGSEFICEHPHGSSQHPLTPVPGDLILLLAPGTNMAGMWINTHAGRTFIHIQKERKTTTAKAMVFFTVNRILDFKIFNTPCEER